jgi:protein translocase SecG subunit
MLTIAQVIISLVLIILILLTGRGGDDASGLFGGIGGGGAYQTRRGLEKIFFWVTIIVAAIFAFLAILNLVL